MSEQDPSPTAESEVEQDLDTLNSDESEDNEQAGADSDEDSSEESGEDRESARRSRGGAKDSEEDTEDEEDEEEEDEPKLGDIEDEEEDEEEPIGDKPEEQPAYSRPPIKAIKEKYPNLFKDFPQLKAAFFNYPQFTEVFADVESAREAATKAQEFDNLESSLVGSGSPDLLFKTLSENNPKALKKMVGNIPETLRSVDSDAYIHLTTPIIEELLYHAAAHGTKTGNKNLQLAARHLANFVFANGGDIPDINKRSNVNIPSEAERQLQKERESYAREKWETALKDVIGLITPEMNQILGNKLDGLTNFERKQIIKEARTEVDKILGTDRSFQQSLKNLWNKAEQQGYSSESKSRIKRAWLDRAKLVAPSVRNRLRQEALGARKGSKREESSENKEGAEPKIKFKVTNQKRTFPDKGGRTPSGQSQRVLDPKKIDWRKTRDIDILNS